jgi:two-component SAPR family response regulator
MPMGSGADSGPSAEPGTAIEVRVFETVSITAADSTTKTIGSLQQKVLLTLLVAQKGASVGLDDIADELWPDVRPPRWRGCIATLATSLRSAAKDRDFAAFTARGYTLHRCADRVRTDVDELQERVEQARAAEEQGRYDVAEASAREALTFYGSGPWTTDPWGWSDLAADAARVLGLALFRRAAYAACVVELRRALELFEWHEGLWACLVYAQHKLGSDRRARELARAAKEAVGGPTPLLAKVEQQLDSAEPSARWFLPTSATA